MTKATTAKDLSIKTWTDGSKRSYAEPPPPPTTTGFSPNFPRLAADYIAPQQWGSASNDARLALACNVVHTRWNGSDGLGSPPRTFGASITAIKAAAPASMGAVPIHTAYVINNEVYKTDVSVARLRDKLNAENWWLRTTWPSGAQVEAGFDPVNLWEINRTTYPRPDANGKTWITWYAELMMKQNYLGEPGNAPCPDLDGLFLDNCFYQTGRSGDWDLDGDTDAPGDPAQSLAVRTAIKQHFDHLRSIWPTSRSQLGNIADLPNSEGGGIYSATYTPNYSLVSPMLGVIDGGLCEYFIDNATINGEPGASKEWQERNNGLAGWDATRNQMRYYEGFVRNPAMMIYSVRDVTNDLNDSANYQRLRFGAAAVTVCSNGAVDDRNLLTWSTMPVIYTNNTGIGWLGQAIDTPRFTPYQNGVYVRQFVNGYVAVNPRNNGAKTFTLSVSVRNVVTGTTYAAGASIPIADRDGAFLAKTEVVAVPSVPGNFTATAVSTSQINLAWSDSTGETNYTLQRSTDGTNFQFLASLNAGVTSYSNTGLNASTRYWYRIQAVNTAGSSAFSTVANATMSAAPPPSGGTFNPNFPRLGAYPIAGDHSYELLSYREHWGKFPVLILTQWNGWQSGRSMTMAQVMADMKTRTPAGWGVAAQYYTYSINEMVPVLSPAEAYIRSAVGANRWYLYNGAVGGTIVFTEDGTNNYYAINNTINNIPWLEWEALWTKKIISDGTTASGEIATNAPNPYCDGNFLDNVLWAKRVGLANYAQTGTTNTDGYDPAVTRALQQGHAYAINYRRQIWPTAKGVLGNITDLVVAQNAAQGDLYTAGFVPNTSVIEPLVPNGVPLLDGGAAEDMIGGDTVSFEYQTRDNPDPRMSYYTFRNHYQFMRKCVRNEALGIFACMDCAKGTAPENRRAERFGLAACTVFGNFSFFGSSSYDAAVHFWMDEYDNGGAGVGWLGQPVTPANPGQYGGGTKYGRSGDVYWREFTNGGVLINMRNNGPVTVPLPTTSTWRRIQGQTGKSDTTVNNGTAITSVTLQDRDAIFVVRTSGAPQPPPPTTFTPIHVNAGGPAFTDPSGVAWAADTNFNTGNQAPTTDPITGTNNPTLYQSNRWDPLGDPELTYTFNVPVNGNYTVRLHFADTYPGTFGAGLRVFGIRINSVTVVSNLDVYATVGGNAALVRDYTTSVTNNTIQITFLHVTENPFVSGIEIYTQGTEPVINATPSAPAISATAPTSTTLTIQVTATPSQGQTVTSYQIERSPDGQTGWTSVTNLTSSSNTASYTNLGLTPSTTYYYRARFTQSNGVISNWSNVVSGITTASKIIWKGDFSTGNFSQWHAADNKDAVYFWQVPQYGRPINYGGVSFQDTGDGSLLSLVQSPTRGSPYTAKFTVKSSVNGIEPQDCDGTVCTRRRTELTCQQMLPTFYNAIPYQRDRWVSFSVFIPADWNFSGTGWGPLICQFKPLNEGVAGINQTTEGLGGATGLSLGYGVWSFFQNWRAERDPSGAAPWQYSMVYTGEIDPGGAMAGPYPRPDFWPGGVVDFPNMSVSHAALRSVFRGGWTDWVYKFKIDARGSLEGGTGYFKVWKREGSGPWIHVLDIRPKVTDRGGMTFDHGIGFNSPPWPGPTPPANNGGFGIKTGMYMEKGQVWDLPNDRVLYITDTKVGDATAEFRDMTHDGSAPV